MLRHITWLLLFAMMASTGCSGDNSASSDGPSEMERMATQLAQEEKDAKAKADAEAAAQAANPTPPAEEAPVRIGDSDKNREETYNPLLAAAHAYVFAENRAIVMQHVSAVKLFHAEKGYYPKSHEDYVKQIVDRELVILPKPDEGYEFWYRPEDPLNLWLRPVGSTGEDAPPPE
jgi:hypothetical protein